jgi:hypothetical protein
MAGTPWPPPGHSIRGGRLGWATVDARPSTRAKWRRQATHPPTIVQPDPVGPFSPSGAPSWAASIYSLYFAVNVRRRARSGTSGSGRCVPAPLIRPGSSIPVARTNVVTLLIISGEALHPRPQVTNSQEAGASTQVGREGRQCSTQQTSVARGIGRGRCVRRDL